MQSRCLPTQLSFREPKMRGVGIVLSTSGCGLRRDEPVTALTFSDTLLPFPAARELLADVGLQTRGRASADKGRSALYARRGTGGARARTWRYRVRVPLRSHC